MSSHSYGYNKYPKQKRKNPRFEPIPKLITCYNCSQSLSHEFYKKNFIYKLKVSTPQERERIEPWCQECLDRDYYGSKKSGAGNYQNKKSAYPSPNAQQRQTQSVGKLLRCENCLEDLPHSAYKPAYIKKVQKMTPEELDAEEPWCIECIENDWYEEEEDFPVEPLPVMHCAFCKKGKKREFFDEDLGYFLAELDTESRKRVTKICTQCKKNFSEMKNRIRELETENEGLKQRPTSRGSSGSENDATLRQVLDTLREQLLVVQREKDELKAEKNDLLDRLDDIKRTWRQDKVEFKSRLAQIQTDHEDEKNRLEEEYERDRAHFEKRLKDSKRKCKEAQSRYNRDIAWARSTSGTSEPQELENSI